MFSLLVIAAPAVGWTPNVRAMDISSDAWLMPFDVGQKRRTDPAVLQPTQQQMYEFAWESFVALNWPYLVSDADADADADADGRPGLRGQPDESALPLPIFGGNKGTGASASCGGRPHIGFGRRNTPRC